MSTENGSSTPLVRLDGVPAGARIVAGGADALVARHVAEQVERARREGQRAACETAAKALAAAAERLDLAREEAAATLASQSVELALEIARNLIRAEVPASGAGRGACVIHVHPHDAAMLAGVRFRAGTAIEPDETVARGDVHVSTANGLLVREIPEALASVEARLGELL